MPSVLTGDREEKTQREEEAEGGGTRPQGPPHLEPPEAGRSGKDPPDPRRERGPADPVISGSRPPGCGTIRVCGCPAWVCGHLSERPGDALGATPNCRFLGPCSRPQGAAQDQHPHRDITHSYPLTTACRPVCPAMPGGSPPTGHPLTSVHRPLPELLGVPPGEGLSCACVACRGRGSLPALVAATLEGKLGLALWPSLRPLGRQSAQTPAWVMGVVGVGIQDMLLSCLLNLHCFLPLLPPLGDLPPTPSSFWKHLWEVCATGCEQ